MKRTSLLLVILCFSSVLFGQNMRRNAQFSLFSDNKAAQPGDAVTIVVLESTQASNNSETSSGRSSDIGFSASGAVGTTKLPNADASLGTKNDFSGSGSTQTTGSIRTKISAVVDSVLANGNMMIRGSKKITINGEEQVVLIKGVIRQSDINADNSVYSHNISEAEISFEGSGLIDSAQKPGWLTKLFHWLF
ncbi:MAG: flagellar basal body L-ring protein FlgH [Ignavibacteria bacterium]|nr:flagellar basal body L-ring protein FlgH [Ignavibacteria bacterium]